MNIHDFFQSKKITQLLWVVVVCVMCMVIFTLGTLVGFRKARFSYQWGENYHRTFAGPRNGFLRDFSGKDFIGSNGIFGQIMKIDDSKLILKGRDDVENIVSVKENTTMKRFGDIIHIHDMAPNDYVVVIGDPNDLGQIEAKFIRVMPPPRQNILKHEFNSYKSK